MDDSTQNEASDLRQKTVSGVSWVSLSQISRQGLQFLTSVILARLLLPQDLGLIGMVLVFTGFAIVLNDLGFGPALIQRQKVEEEHLTAVFWLNILTGITLTLILAFLAPFIALFYQEPRLIPLVRLLSIDFSITSFAVVQKAILSRDLRFKELAIIEIGAVIIAGIVAITLALLDFGVWSLAWQMLIISILSTVILWMRTDWWPKLQFNKKAIQELLNYSSNLLGFNIFNYWSRNADNLLIGRFLGATGLGLYTTAYSIMLLPLSQITRMLSRVMFPALSRVQQDQERVKRIYLRSISLIALITFPMMAGLFSVAEEFIMVVYGEKWLGLIRPLQILTIVGLYQSVGATVGWIYQSQGRTDWMFRWGIFAGTAGIVSFLIGIKIGTIEAVASSYAILNVLLLYWLFTIPGKLINMTIKDVFKSLAGVAGCTLLMVLIVELTGLLLTNNWTSLPRLIVQVTVGGCVYLTALHVCRIKAYEDMKQLFIEQLHMLQNYQSKRRIDTNTNI